MSERTCTIGALEQQVILDPDRVPENLKHLIGLAQTFGIEDDDCRMAAVNALSAEMRKKLRTFVQECERELDDWLAGPESEGEVSYEYEIFTYLRRAAEGY